MWIQYLEEHNMPEIYDGELLDLMHGTGVIAFGLLPDLIDGNLENLIDTMKENSDTGDDNDEE